MSIDLTPLATLPAHAAEMIATPDRWTQGTELDEQTGAMCLTGALIRACTVPGDGYIARAVYRHWDRGEEWNDATDRVHADVLDVLHREITADDLAETFGPQWEPIVALVRRCAVLTVQEATGLDATRDATWDAAAWVAARVAARVAAWDAAWEAARAAAWVAARVAARVAAWDAAWVAAREAARDAARAAAWDAARDAARALVVRDLISPLGFTQEHYDLLTRAWAQTIGPVHPDDKPVTA